MFLCDVGAETQLRKVRIVVPRCRHFKRRRTRLTRRYRRASLLRRDAHVNEYTIHQRSSLVTSTSEVPIVILTVHSRLFRESSTIGLSIANSVRVVSCIHRTPITSIIPTTDLGVRPPPLENNKTISGGRNSNSRSRRVRTFEPDTPTATITAIVVAFEVDIRILFFIFRLVKVLF